MDGTLTPPPIRDADLLAELEANRGKLGFEFTRQILERRQADRDRLAAMAPAKRRRAEIAKRLENPPSLADLRHIHSTLAIAGLPYERLTEGTHQFARKQGNMALDVMAGALRDQNGNLVQQPIPYGPKARLVLMHLCSEAIQQKSATIEIADTFTGFVRDMGFSDSGGRKGPLTAFKEQLNALAACTMRISSWNGQSVRTKAFVPLENIELWLSSDPNQRSLWPSTVTFSTAMYDSLSRHALPLNKHVLKAFAGSSRKLDIYAWLSWRMYNLDAPLTLSWQNLYDQFGGQNTEARGFKRHFKDDLAEIKEVLTKLPAQLTNKGLTIRPADPHVLALPIKRLTPKKA